MSVTAPPPADDPRAAYSRRHAERAARAEQLRRRLDHLGRGRLAVFLLGLAAGWAAFGPGWLSPYWLAGPALGLVYLLFAFERVSQQWRRAGRAAEFYRRGLDRLDDRWAGAGEQGARYLDEHHPYAADLD